MLKSLDVKHPGKGCLSLLNDDVISTFNNLTISSNIITTKEVFTNYRYSVIYKRLGSKDLLIIVAVVIEVSL